VHGQRTHTNARTRKGPRKGAVAAKKKTMARKYEVQGRGLIPAEREASS
jgi:hypothetical protein